MIQITKKLTGKKYWRSLDQYYQTPEFQEWLNSEFPSEAAEMLDEPSRRNILKLMGASFALGGLTACRRPVEHILPILERRGRTSSTASRSTTTRSCRLAAQRWD